MIGLGEVGRRCADACRRQGWQVHEVRRDAGWQQAVDPQDPALRLIAVREDDMQAVVERLAPVPRQRWVLVQNGFLEPILGDLEEVTRGLVYFTAKGEFFEVLCPSLLFGHHAERLSAALDAAGLAARTVGDRGEFLQAMIVKGIWNAVVGLPLAVHELNLGEYLEQQQDELRGLVQESAGAAGAAYGVAVEPQAALDKLYATTGKLGWVRGGAKALRWRNGAIAWFGRRHGVATPINDRLLRAVGYDPEGSPAPGVSANTSV